MTKKKIVMLIAAGCSLLGSASLQAAPEIKETYSTLKEWVEIQKTISEERSDWAVEQETLKESIDLLSTEIEDLKVLIKENEENVSKSDARRAELNAERDELKAASAIIRDAIGSLEKSTLDLVEYLPKNLRDSLSQATNRIPKTRKEIEAASLSNRITIVMGVLSKIEEFNSKITVAEEYKEINGKNVRVDLIYIGLAVGYYVDGTQTIAGTMTPAKGEWVRTEDNTLAPEVAAAVGMLAKSAGVSPRFVDLPVSVGDIN